MCASLAHWHPPPVASSPRPRSIPISSSVSRRSQLPLTPRPPPSLTPCALFLAPRYAWEALTINELQPLYLYLQVQDLPPVPDISGTLFLDILGVDAGMLTNDIIILTCMYAGMAVAAVLAMMLRMALVRSS